MCWNRLIYRLSLVLVVVLACSISGVTSFSSASSRRSCRKGHPCLNDHPSRSSTSSGILQTFPTSRVLSGGRHSMALSAIFDPTTLTISSGVLTNENIKAAFSVATFLPQFFWALLVLLPNSNITKKIMGGMEVVTILCLVHFFIVTASIAQPSGTAPMAEFNDVFDPSGDPQAAMVGMMKYPNFVTEEWSHVLTWDLFVGRWIWLDGLKRGVFTPHSVLLCNLIGPPGLLLHLATCLVSGKGILPNELLDDVEGGQN